LDKVNIAKSVLFDGEERFSEDDLFCIMECALFHNRPDFVQLLIDNNFNFDKFLTKERYCKLYEYLINKKDAKEAPFVNFLEANKRQHQLVKFAKNKDFFSDIGTLTDCICFLTEKEIEINIDNNQFKDPTQALFIWSVLNNRPKIAKIFLTKTKDQIALCLLATIVFKKFAFHFRNKEDKIFDENAK
jgi:transient receptor potential cation channel subfamily M member 8